MSDSQLSRIEKKIDAIGERLNNIDVTLVKQNLEIEHHIKRTDLLEEQVKPVVEHVTFVKVSLRWLGAAALVAGILKAFGAL